MIDTISKILEDYFSYVYCDTCKYGDEFGDNCEYCHRKYICWELSHGQAVYLAEKIVKAMEDFK